MKLATIMAITNNDRASDLHALDRRFIQETPEGMLFRIPGLRPEDQGGLGGGAQGGTIPKVGFR